MGQILHKLARITEIIRNEIQNSNKSISELVRLYGISRPTVYKWKNAENTSDKKSGARKIRSSLT